MDRVNKINHSRYKYITWSILATVLLWLYPVAVNAQLSGNYTINQGISASSTNFTTFNEAFDSLAKNGVSGAVTFYVVDTAGAYSRTLLMRNVHGDSTYPIIFRNSPINNGRAVINPSNYLVPALRIVNSSHVTFRDLEFRTLWNRNETILLLRDNKYISFINDSFSSSSSDVRASVGSSTIQGDLQHHILMDSCTFNCVGYVGFNGNTSNYYFFRNKVNHHNVISNNTWLNGGGINLFCEYDGVVYNNSIYSTSLLYNSFIVGYYVDGYKIDRNTIVNTAKRRMVGIDLSQSSIYTTKQNEVTNNSVYLDNSDSVLSAVGLDLNFNRYTKVYHNSVYVNTRSDASFGLVLYDSATFNNEFFNNIITVKGEAKVGEVNYEYFARSDYNNYYHESKDSAITWKGTLIKTNDLTSFSATDSHSLFINPYFKADSVLHPTSPHLNNSAYPSGFVSYDIDGDSRSSTTPDIGADEFTPPKLASGIENLTEKEYCDGNNVIRAVYKNLGLDTIRSASILYELSINGGGWDSVKTVYWTGTLASTQTDTINFGTFDIRPGKAYSSRFTVIRSNGVMDNDGINKVFVSPTFSGLLHGVYTVGGPASDYPSLQFALDNLHQQGICAPVTLKLVDTVFKGPFFIKNIPHASATDSVLITSLDTGNNWATLNRANQIGDTGVIFNFTNAGYITFRRLKFIDDMSRGREKYFLFDGRNKSICFNNNIFGSYPTYSISVFENTDSSVIDGLTLSECVFGSDSTYAPGKIFNLTRNRDSTKHSNIKIVRNVFNRYTISLINLNVAENIDISDNFIHMYRESGSTIIDLANTEHYLIERNRIRIVDGIGISVFNSGSQDSSSRIRNNQIQFTGSDGTRTCEGIRFLQSRGKVDHNTVAIWNSSPNSVCFTTVTAYKNPLSIYSFVGNSLVNYSKGTVASFASSDISTISTNNFYSTGACVLKDFQKDSSGQTTNVTIQYRHDNLKWNSIALDPFYRLEDSLTYPRRTEFLNRDSISGLKTDLVGNARDSLPDIGCLETELVREHAELISFNEQSFCAGQVTPSVIVRNEGADTIEQLSLSFYTATDSGAMIKNGSSDWKGILPPAQTVIVQLNSFTITDSNWYTFKVVVDSTNHKPDTLPRRSAIVRSDIESALSGEYAVGDTTDPFPDIYTAAEKLKRGGVCGPVRFLVRGDTFHKELIIPRIKGTSKVNTVEFTAHPEDSILPRIQLDTFNRCRCLVELDSASFINLDSFELQLNYPGDNYDIISVQGDAENIVLSNLRLGGKAQYGVKINHSSYDKRGGLLIDHCEFNYFHYSVYYSRSNYDSLTQDKIIRVTNNTFNGYEFMQLSEDSIIITGNITNKSGVFLLNGKYVLIDGNTATIRNGPSPKRDHILKLNVVDNARVSNNMFSIIDTGSNNPFLEDAIILIDRSTCTLVHNSFYLKTPSKDYSAPIIHYQGNLSLYNNCIVTSDSVLLLRNINGTIVASDHNNWYTPIEVMQYGATRHSLEYIRKTTGMDSHSLFVDPQYFADSNLHIKNLYLNMTGYPGTGITNDIDGDTRDSLHPDIGADEFSLPGIDVFLTDEVWNSLCTDTQSYQFTVQNTGEDTVRHMVISSQVGKNNNAWLGLSDITWTGNLPPREVVSIHGPPFVIEKDSIYRLRFTVDSVNHELDTVTANNTVTTDSFTNAMSGEYTVNGSNPDYPDLNDAFADLEKRGICGPVRLLLNEGLHKGPFELHQINGSGPLNTIEIVSNPRNNKRAELYLDSTNNAYTFFNLNGVSHLIIDSINMTSDEDSTYVFINLQNVCHHIEITHDSLISTKSGPKGSPNTVFVKNHYGHHVNSILIENNHFKSLKPGGAHGIYLYTNFEFYSINHSVKVSSNTLENIDIGLVIAADSLYIRNNRIFRNSFGKQNVVAIGGSPMEVTGNLISAFAKNYSAGIAIGSPADTSRPVIFSNNIIEYTMDSTNHLGCGILIRGASNYPAKVIVAHNTVKVNAMSTARGACILVENYIDTVGSLKLINNLLLSSGNSVPLQMDYYDSLANIYSNYNNLYNPVGDSVNLYYGPLGFINKFSDYRAMTGFDSATTFIDPEFIPFSPYTPNNFDLDGTGAPLSEFVPYDYYGNLRDTVNPDVGAVEFQTIRLYPEVNQLKALVQCAERTTVQGQVINRGLDTIRSIKYTVFIKDTAADFRKEYDTSWNGIIAPDDTVSIVFGQSILSNDSGIFVVSIDTLNQSARFVKSYSSDTTILVKTTLSGSFNVGYSNDDFITIQEAIDELAYRGICGHVRLQIREGTYYEQLVIPEIQGTSDSATVTLVNHPDNKIIPKIQYSAFRLDKNYVLQFRRSSFIILDSLFFTNTNVNIGNVITLFGENKNITIKNSSMSTGTGRPYPFYTFAPFSGISEDTMATDNRIRNLTVDNCTFIKGLVGIDLGRKTKPNAVSGNITITNCSFTDQVYHSMRLINLDSIYVQDNDILIQTTKSDSMIGLYLDRCKNGRVRGNTIRVSCDDLPSGIALSNSTGALSRPFEVANNMIIVQNNTGYTTGLAAGIVLKWGNENLDIVHNSVLAMGNDNGLSALYHEGGYPEDSVKVYNNIFAAHGAAFSTFTPSNTVWMLSDYNCYYAETPVIIYWKRMHYGLNTLKTMGTDNHSMIQDPGFINSGDLHLQQTWLNGRGKALKGYSRDIDKELRDSLYPDIGADEIPGNIHDVACIGFEQIRPEFCERDSLPVSIVVRNTGDLPESGFRLTMILSGPVRDTFSTTYKDTLQRGQSDTVFLKTLALQTFGNYQFKVFVSSPGDSVTSNDTSGFTWVYRGSVLNVPDYTGCENQSGVVKLEAPKGYPDYKWYDQETGGKLLGSSQTLYLMNPSQSDTFYLEIDKDYQGTVGFTNLPAVSSSNKYLRGLRFNVNEDVILDSVSVIPWSDGILTIRFKDSSGNVIAIVSDSVFFSNFKFTSFPVNVYLPAGQNYTVDAFGTTVSKLTNTPGSGMAFPFSDSANRVTLMSDIDGNTYFYDYFYNWKIHSPVCNPGRIPARVNLLKNPEGPVLFNDTICAFEYATIRSNDTSGTIRWYPFKTSNTVLATGDSIKLGPLTTNRTVFAEIDSSNGCTSVRSEARAIVYQYPAPPPIVSDTFKCSQDALILSSSSGEIWRWCVSDCTNGSTYDSVFLVENNMDTLQVFRTDHGCESSASETVIEHRANPRKPEITGDTNLCSGDTLQLMTRSGAKVFWQDSDSTDLGYSSSMVVPDLGVGGHTFILTLDSGGCRSTQTGFIQVQALPQIPDVQDDSVCPGRSILLTAVSLNPVKWYASDTSEKSFHTGYTLWLDSVVHDTSFIIVADSAGCLSMRRNIKVITDSALIPSLALSGNDTACFGDSSIAIATVASGTTVYWYTDPNLVNRIDSGNRFTVLDTGMSGTYFVQGENKYCSSTTDSVLLLIATPVNSKFDHQVIDTVVEFVAEERGPGTKHRWLLPDITINDLDSFRWKPLTNDTHTVAHVIIDEITGCSDTTVLKIHTNTISYRSVTGPHGIRVYPIPNKDQLHIDLQEQLSSGPLYLIYDMHGRKVMEGLLGTGRTSTIDHQLSAGAYRIDIFGDETVYRVRFIVE